jgi:DNA polymerase III alpha subunit
MAFVKMSDYTDGIESVFFPEAFAKAKDVLVPGSCIMIKGKVSNRNDEKSFMADAAKKL